MRRTDYQQPASQLVCNSKPAGKASHRQRLRPAMLNGVPMPINPQQSQLEDFVLETTTAVVFSNGRGCPRNIREDKAMAEAHGKAAEFYAACALESRPAPCMISDYRNYEVLHDAVTKQ